MTRTGVRAVGVEYGQISGHHLPSVRLLEVTADAAGCPGALGASVSGLRVLMLAALLRADSLAAASKAATL